ncbi:MAG: ABC transporter ATP-binding protein [Chloroflexi bacterium]|nr:ABC transporter ATP-binding protein [Chloroflexota bacterium]
MTAIRIEGLRKFYGPVHALDGLNLTVEPGTVFGFLGPNGAGKTTTLRILTGLTHATEGQAWVIGTEITTNRREVARRIGYLPEEPAFYPWLTPREFLDHIGRVFGLSASERAVRVKELLDLLGLAEVAKRRIAGFSRGMRQRLGLAQALVNRPEVLFLDEPVSALDPAGRKEVLELIETLRGQHTVFMSSHILADVERVCDTIGIIGRGRLVTQAPRETLLAQYAIPALEVEADRGFEMQINAWAEALRGRSWVQSVSIKGLTARAIVNDVETAKQELLASAMQAGLVLTRFEILRPSLEDVFLRLMGKEGQTP